MNDQISQLQLHQIRVIEEKSELDGRLRRLTEFIESPTFHTLTATESMLLVEQSGAMARYSAILGKRIDNWTRK